MNMQIRLVFRNKFFGEKAVENRLMIWNNERCQRFLKKMVLKRYSSNYIEKKIKNFQFPHFSHFEDEVFPSSQS